LTSAFNFEANIFVRNTCLLNVDYFLRTLRVRFLKSSLKSYRTITSYIHYLIMVYICLSVTVVNATEPVAPDAGALLHQMERGLQAPIPEAKAPILPLQQELKSLNGLSVKVVAFQFQGNTLVDSERLMLYVKQWVGKDNTFEDLQNATISVAKAYRDEGWVVRTFLPEQDVSTGVITIQVVEAVLGKVLINKPADVRLSDDEVRSYIAAAQPIGAHISQHAIDRSLLILQDLGVASIEGNLAKGDADSETDLILAFKPRPLLDWIANIDNLGGKSTGIDRESLSVSAHGLLKIGDLTNVNIIHTKGSDYIRLEETLPIGYSGLQVGGYVANFNYSNIDPAFSRLSMRGKSLGVGLFQNYPLIRSIERNLFLKFAQDYKTISNQAMGRDTSNYAITVASGTLVGNIYDGFLNGGVNNASLSVILGNIDLDGSPNQSTDARGPKVAGRYGKIFASASRLQALPANNVFYVKISGQYASKNLDSSEQFYLGGSSAVRAYPSSQGGLSEGFLVNLELRHAFLQNFTLAGFYDYGQGIVNKNNNFTGKALINNYDINGVGIYLGINSFYGFSGNATWSHRLGLNPLRTSAGRDPDGTYNVNRFWLTLSRAF